jgi:ABC-type polysaccharide/polyol phosphate export permease
VRDLKARYIGSFMGFFWSVIHPLVLLAIYTFVFHIVFEIRPYSKTTDNFAVFLFCGILPWLYFQDTVTRCCNSIVENANLIRKTLFPSEILPVSIVVSNLVPHLIGLGILLVVLAFMGLLNWTALGMIPFLLLLSILSLGLGWITAALQVFLRDTLQILSVLMIVWFWFTPIFYTVEMVPAYLKPVMQLNPLAYAVNGYRLALLENEIPEVSSLLILGGFAFGAVGIGGYLFRNTKREFVDVL